MPRYIQRRSERGFVETVDEADDRREAHRLAAEYNIADKSAQYYVKRYPCKAYKTKHS